MSVTHGFKCARSVKAGLEQQFSVTEKVDWSETYTNFGNSRKQYHSRVELSSLHTPLADVSVAILAIATDLVLQLIWFR